MQSMPTDLQAFEAMIIETATTWTAYIRRGPTIKERHDYATRDEALARAGQMAAAHGRNALIYASTAAGRSTLAGYVAPNQTFTSAVTTG